MLQLMTNKQAADVLRIILESQSRRIGRGNGKSTTNLIVVEAFMKAIALLQNTPDQEDSNN